MSSQKKIGINVVLNMLRKSLSVLFPIITLPYTIRALGVENIGKINYSHSIISYFALVAMLGISKYAIREGAKKKESKQEFAKFVNEVFSINLVFTTIAYLALFICIIFIPQFKKCSYLLLLQSVSILLTTLSIDWVNTVNEDFLIITVRSIFSHILFLALLFLFVHKPEDYYLYALLTVVSDGVVCLTNLIYCRRYIQLRPVFHMNFNIHIKPILIFFANEIAISIYVNIDTTMLGWIKGAYDVGVYSLAVKIYVAVKSLITAMYNVSIPRLSYYWGNKQYDKFKELLTDMFGFISVLLIPATVGLFMISDAALVLLGGTEYMQAAKALQILSFALLFAIYGGLVCDCLNISIGRERDNMFAAILSALINFIINLFLIPLFSYNGAALTTLIAEAFVMLFCYVRIPDKNNYLEKKKVIRTMCNALLGSMLVVGVSLIIKLIVSDILVRLMVTIIAASIMYCVFMIIIGDRYFKVITNLLMRKMRRIF